MSALGSWGAPACELSLSWKVKEVIALFLMIVISFLGLLVSSAVDDHSNRHYG